MVRVLKVRLLLVVLAAACVSCAAILGISDYEEADCVRDCGVRSDATDANDGG